MYVFVYVYGSLYKQQISNTNRPPKQKFLAPPLGAELDGPIKYEIHGKVIPLNHYRHYQLQF